MHKPLLTSLALVFALGMHAQITPEIEWQRALGGSNEEDAADILPTPDGGSILVGFSISSNGDASGNHGNTDFWVVKQDPAGNVQWQRMYGGSGYDGASSVAPVAGGGFVIAGRTNSQDGDVSGPDNGSFSDIWVIRIDELGDLIWQKKFGGSFSESGRSIRQAADGGFLLFAEVRSDDGDIDTNHGYADFWLAKLASTGELLWQRSYGGSSDDAPFAIHPTTDGGNILVGFTESVDGDVTGNHGWADGWVVKVDSLGNLEWQRALGGSGNDFLSAVTLTGDGGYVVVGRTESSDGDVIGYHGGGSDMWVVKLDADGNLIWQNALGGSADSQGRSIIATNDGGFIVAGSTSASDGDVTFNNGAFDGWVVKLDSLGELVWEKTMGGSATDSPSTIRSTTDGGFLLAGYSQSNDGDVGFNHGDKDVWVVKLGPEPTGISELYGGPALSVFPNPAERLVSIRCELVSAGPVRLDVFNSTGQLLMTPIHEAARPGEQIWHFDTSVLAAGVYQLRFVTDEGMATRSLVKVE